DRGDRPAALAPCGSGARGSGAQEARRALAASGQAKRQALKAPSQKRSGRQPLKSRLPAAFVPRPGLPAVALAARAPAAAAAVLVAARRLLGREVHAQRAAIEIAAVHRLHRLRGRGLVFERDKAEPAGAARVPVRDDPGLDDLAVGIECTG